MKMEENKVENLSGIVQPFGLNSMPYFDWKGLDMLKIIYCRSLFHLQRGI